MKIQYVGTTLPASGVVFVGCFEDGTLVGLDNHSSAKEFIAKAISLKKFKGKKNKDLRIVAPTLDGNISEIIVLGLGEKCSLSPLDLEKIGGRIGHIASTLQDDAATIFLSGLTASDLSAEKSLAHIVNGAVLRAWSFTKYQTKKHEEQAKLLKTLSVSCENEDALKKAYHPFEKIQDGVFLTRHVVSEPANVLYPESMFEFARELSSLGVDVEALDEKRMKELGMGALLGVAQGSANKPYLIVLRWNGGKEGEAPIAFVGKGVTFDTGGISIKPAGDMDEMKADMAGSGAVLGLLKALAGRQAKVNVVGVLGMVENMPSSTAQRPGDIVTTMSGQTIEVLNTDAEGRLVLADALWYTQDHFKPKMIIDLATLTGAIVVALGAEYAGLFSNDDKIAAQLYEAGAATGERLWRLPLAEEYDRDIDSPIADVKNIGSGRGAGSITAAQFLQRFVNKTPWAHLDIAGTALVRKATPLSAKGATAFGVRLLDQFIRANYE